MYSYRFFDPLEIVYRIYVKVTVCVTPVIVKSSHSQKDPKRRFVVGSPKKNICFEILSVVTLHNTILNGYKIFFAKFDSHWFNVSFF